jgi:hypothetical protein
MCKGGVTLFVTRERGEHVNMYHSMTDFFNAFMTVEMVDVDPKQVGLSNTLSCLMLCCYLRVLLTISASPCRLNRFCCIMAAGARGATGRSRAWPAGRGLGEGLLAGRTRAPRARFRCGREHG